MVRSKSGDLTGWRLVVEIPLFTGFWDTSQVVGLGISEASTVSPKLVVVYRGAPCRFVSIRVRFFQVFWSGGEIETALACPTFLYRIPSWTCIIYT